MVISLIGNTAARAHEGWEEKRRGRAMSLSLPSSRPSSERPSRTATPSLGGRTTPSSLSSLLRPSTADTREQGLRIRHGVLPTYTYRVGERIQNVLFQASLNESQVLTDQNSCLSFVRGRRKGKWNLGSPDGEEKNGIFKLLHASHHNVYVGICRNAIKLFNEVFEYYFEVTTDTEIICAVYNESSSGEIITSSHGSITVWTFRQGGRRVAPFLVIKDGLQERGSGGGESVTILHMEDVPGRAQRCFAAVHTGINVYQVCSGRLLSSQTSLHHCPLSAILFFRPLRLLLTADCDGAIKVWDSEWKLCCTFIGHREAVTALSSYPHGPLVMSGSLDSTVRVWDLSTHNQVDCLDNGAPVLALHSSPGTPHILTTSHTLVKGWRVQELYKRSAVVGREIFNLAVTTHPMIPRRLLATCADSAVRLVCPVGGHVITTALLPLGQRVVSLVYFPLIESLYVLEDKGTVTVFNASQRPCQTIAHWIAPSSIGTYTCLAHYEQTMNQEEIEEMLAQDQWLGVVLEARELSRLSLHTKDPLTLHREGTSLLLAGTNEGHVALVDHTSGDLKYNLKVHSGPVKLLECDAKHNYVFSSSNDSQIFISRLHPHIHESPLSLVMSFDVTSSPSLLSITPDRVGVVCNDHAHSSYTIDMYYLQERASFTGDPEHSHQAEITGFSSFPQLHLFASTSLDSTLRIWNSENHPIRVLQLDASPLSLVYSSLTAHITISLNRHLYTIDPTTYLPEPLLNQLVSMTTEEVEEQLPRELTSDLLTLTPEDLQRLEVVDDAIQQDAYKGALSSEEMNELEELAREKVMGMSLLVERDNEIRGILNGTILASKKRVGLRGRDKEKAWQEMYSLLHPPSLHPPINIPEVDDFDPDTYGRTPPVEEPYSPYQKGPRLSFFPPLATFEPPYPVAPDGVLPNSALLDLMRKNKADQAMADSWSPPVLSDQQKRLMAEMEEKEEEEEIDSDLESQLQAALDADYTTPPPSLSPTPPPSPEEPSRRKIVPLKLEKLVAPPPPPKPPTPPPRSPTPKSPTPPPTPPPPPTPLPEYIAQFIGRSWFDKLYPGANSSTFPKPWSVTRFIISLLSHLSRPSLDSFTKADICQAIHHLLKSYSPSNIDDIHKTVLEQLTTPPCPSFSNPSHRPLITSSLALLYHINVICPAVVIVGMVGSVEERMVGGGGGGGEVEKQFVAWLEKGGVSDPHGYFTRHLNNSASSQQVGSDVKTAMETWLEHWAAQELASRQKTTNTTNTRGHHNSRPSKKKAGMKGVSPLTSCNVIDVINYFIRIEHENELAKRVVTPPPAPPTESEELPRNTVLTLPRITRSRRVARLGETHCSCCHPERESTFYYRLPPVKKPSRHPSGLWTGFSRTLSLAMKPQTINPFLTEEEQEAEEQEEVSSQQQQEAPPTLTSLRLKYFLPEQSVVQTHHHT